MEKIYILKVCSFSNLLSIILYIAFLILTNFESIENFSYSNFYFRSIQIIYISTLYLLGSMQRLERDSRQMAGSRWIGANEYGLMELLDVLMESPGFRDDSRTIPG